VEKIKLGIHKDSHSREKLVDLLICYSTKSGDKDSQNREKLVELLIYYSTKSVNDEGDLGEWKEIY
jgi:HSP90 family molecular chaperone